MAKRKSEDRTIITGEPEQTNNNLTTKIMTKRRTLISAATYHNFEEEPLFRGVYMGECKNEEGKLIGFLFCNEDGEEEMVTNSYSIEKALNMETEHGLLVKDSNLTIEIEFKDKITIKKTGKPFNRFQVCIME